jgi:succinylglutamate desuccinylase
MNRQWLKENIDHCLQADSASMAEEDNELKELFSTIQEEIEKTKPSRIVLLDLHTTSARGGIFSIATDHPESVRIAIELHAPVILGMLRGIDGTTLHYFVSENFGIPVTAIAFEAGHHRNPLSVNRSISAIINCMRTIGSVKREDVEHHHDEILIQYSKGLPRLAELILVHKIEEDDEFRMNPGFLNFQSVVKGQELACDRHGPITAPDNGLILMPLYQKEGKEGFFIVKKKA